MGQILRDYGEESNWRSLQTKIVKARLDGGLHSTGELVELVKSTSGKSGNYICRLGYGWLIWSALHHLDGSTISLKNCLFFIINLHYIRKTSFLAFYFIYLSYLIMIFFFFITLIWNFFKQITVRTSQGCVLLTTPTTQSSSHGKFL